MKGGAGRDPSDPRRGQQTEPRPWGWFQVQVEEPLFKIKKIVVHPGRRLSLQRHRHRDEHWFIIQGKALVTLDDRRIELVRGGAVDIVRESFHRVENISSEDLVFVEVATGDYCGEDDIERIEDDYGRACM
jgi:mannose-1-phosphate guanylyltransferase/mannose-6-phosphate isomerase